MCQMRRDQPILNFYFVATDVPYLLTDSLKNIT